MASTKKSISDYKKVLLQILVLTAAVIAFVVISTSLFGDQLKAKAEKSFLQSVRASATGLESEMGQKLFSARSAMLTAAGFISEDGEGISPEHYVELLSQMNAAMLTEGLYISEEDGSYVLQDGSRGDASDYPWHKEVMEGKEVMNVYEVFIGNIGGEKFVISCPIREGGKVTGTITALLPISIFTEAAAHNRAEWNAGYIMIDKNGRVLVTTGLSAFPAEDIIYDNSAFHFKGDMTKEILSEDMSKGKNGDFYCTIGSKDYYIRYEPVKGDTWYLLSLIAESHRKAQINNSVNGIKQQEVGFVTVFLIFVALVIWIFLTELKSDSRSMSKLQNDAEKDLLTGVYNKLSTEKYIREYMEENGSSGMFFIIDIDDFKHINDSYGHAFGDEVLKTVGKRLNTEFRATDIIGRLGGDEFCVFLKNLNNEEEKKKQSERMANVFKDIYAGEHVKYNPTASIGGAEFPKYGSTFEEIYRAADHALYDVKKNGKNGIRIYEREG